MKKRYIYYIKTGSFSFAFTNKKRAEDMYTRFKKIGIDVFMFSEER
jgi:hypothetical protein